MLLCVLRFVLKCCWLAPSVSLRTNEKSAQTEVMTPEPPVSLPPQEVASADTG
jgi:hypothetical protein